MSPLHMDGAMIVENPYGNLPASQYGSLPFYTFMCFLYVISVVVWGMLCISYSKEVMSVQIIILIVIVIGLVRTLIRERRKGARG